MWLFIIPRLASYDPVAVSGCRHLAIQVWPGSRPGEQLSTVSPFDIVGGFLMSRSDKHVRGISMFDHLAQQHENAFVAGAPGLGHVMGNDQDGVFAAQSPNQFFDGFDTLGVQGGTAAVESISVIGKLSGPDFRAGY